MRLIDADALMKELEREVELADDWKTAHEIANVVKYFPAIEPERKTGKWIIDPGIGCKCSVCGFDIGNDLDFMEYVNFCPNCGADMGGGQDDKP